MRCGALAVTLVTWGLACGAPGPPSSERVARQPEAILNSEAGADTSGVVFVSNDDSDSVCSGVLIAPDLVLTAKHCAFSSSSAGDLPLPEAGFHVGFGVQEGALALRAVDRLDWIGAPDSGSVASAESAGLDVATLHLANAAPESEQVREVSLTFSPADREVVALAGFGITDWTTGLAGTRGLAWGAISALDSTSGVVETTGAAVCFGDSGGPMLSADGLTVLGVIGQVGIADAGPCLSAIAFVDTAVEPEVRRFLEKACAGVGGCGPTERDAAAASGGDSAAGSTIDAPVGDAGPDASAMTDLSDARPGSSASADRGDATGGCSIRPIGPRSSAPLHHPAMALAILVGLVARRRRGQALRAMDQPRRANWVTGRAALARESPDRPERTRRGAPPHAIARASEHDRR